MLKLSDRFSGIIKKSLLDAIQNEVDYFLNDLGGGKVFMPFYADSSIEEAFNYFLIEDLEDWKKFDGLEQLCEKYLSEFDEGDHLLVYINGKTVNSVKFYIARGLVDLSDAIEQYGNIVGINHVILSHVKDDTFKIADDGKNIFYFNDKKR